MTYTVFVFKGEGTMKNPRGLSVWVNSKINKKGGTEFKSNRAFARHFHLDNKTVARLKNDQPIDQTTLQKLAAGRGMELHDFLNMIAEFDNNPDDSAFLDSEITGRLGTLKEDQKQNVLALIRSLQEGNRKRGSADLR